MTFKLATPYSLAGDQPEAIESLVEGLRAGEDRLTLLGVTGSGKTFTMANVIARLDRPALILSPNKTLAAQLYAEFKQFFPENAVEYFVSYYDYYQPEAYIPSTDTYIDKDSAINERIDRLRLSATTTLLSRRDVVVVASISCIYGLGAPSEYQKMTLPLAVGQAIPARRVIRRLVEMQYTRGEDLARGSLRFRGETLDIHPAWREDAWRIVFAGDEIEALQTIDPLSGTVLSNLKSFVIFPAKHFVQSAESIEAAVARIEAELVERLAAQRAAGRVLEAERLQQRTNYDLEMIREMGYCKGIENYSRHLTGRAPGEPPYTLLDYFPDDMLLFIDESHVATGQIEGMYSGDRSRKETLVDFGFRLPSALDNRPLKGAEFHARIKQAVYVSATPGNHERARSKRVVEQIIRPTGLVDPAVEVRAASTQVEDLVGMIRECVGRGERALVTTLTKRTAEELASHFEGKDIKVGYLHSEIKTLDRIETLKDLRSGEIDVLVGVNLLREGLDLPEVSLVAILDADREGFLRSETSLVQMMGRAARHRTGRVILYADDITGSMRRAIEETDRRRARQLEYNELMGITPVSISKSLDSLNVFTTDPLEEELFSDEEMKAMPPDARGLLVDALRREMDEAASALDFERAAWLRDRIEALEGKRAARRGRKGRR